MSKLKKFSPLPQQQISQIISQSESIIPPIAARVQHKIEEHPNHKILIGLYNAATDKKEFLNNNMQKVTRFLNECELVGYPGEVNDLNKNTYVLGMDGVSLISSYMDSKGRRDVASHPVKAVKNTQIIAPNGSRKHSDNFLATNGILPAFQEQLLADFREAGDGKFEKSYLVETFGTNGGDHVLCLTIRKEAGEKDPLIHLFDSSNSLIRNGVEANKNSIAGGWCSQMTVNATLKAVFDDLYPEFGLTFNLEKYYNNSEPLQRSGSSLCATFACETAHEFAAMSREQHEAHLQGYQYPSLFGGKTERLVDLDHLENGYMPQGPSALPAQKVVMSHFTDTGLKPRLEELDKVFHETKGGKVETMRDRIARYQSPEGENQIAEQKALRQKIGHLFEIVTNHEFLQKAEGVEYVPIDQPYGESPYIPAGADFQKPPEEAAGLVKELNRILPVTNKVNRCEVDEEAQTVTAVVYIGKITGDRIKDLMREKEISVQERLIDLSANVVGVNPELSQLTEMRMVFPRDRIADLEEEFKTKKPIYQPANHSFMPQGVTAPIRGVGQLQGGKENRLVV